MLDLDDVAATSPQAQTELAELRARLAEAERERGVLQTLLDDRDYIRELVASWDKP